MVFGFFVPIVIVYVLMALLLKPMPTQLFASEKEEQFWRKVSVSPNLSVSDLRKRFRGPRPSAVRHRKPRHLR